MARGGAHDAAGMAGPIDGKIRLGIALTALAPARPALAQAVVYVNTTEDNRIEAFDAGTDDDVQRELRLEAQIRF